MPEIIKSKDNEKIKLLKKLTQKKYREEYNQFFIENLKTIKSAEQRISALFVASSLFEKKQDEIDDLVKKADQFFLFDDSLNKIFSELDTPSGICAVYNRQDSELDFDCPLVYLNDVNDPGNLGTILRSALAFGFKNIIVDEKCVDIYNSKTLNAAKDSFFKINIARDNKFEILRQIKKKMKIYATRLEGGKQPAELGQERLFCLIFGNEARGVSAEAAALADDFIKIKIASEIESLNVAVSASIIFYEFSKRQP